jgi:hypothetical protein
MKRFGSALIAVACRINQPESRKHAFRPLALFGQRFVALWRRLSL